jgi:hypothetical protein
MTHILTFKTPIVIIPGFAGSKLIDKTKLTVPKLSKIKAGNNISCSTKKNGFINLNLFDKEWQQRYVLKYDPENPNCSIDDDIDIYDFGGVDGIQNLCEDCSQLDSLFMSVLKKPVISDIYNYKYFDDLVERLTNRSGYIGGENLHGAPYDFRKIMIPEYLEDYLKKMKDLIEKTYEANRNKVLLVSHSIGCLITYLFLVGYCDISWKNKYIKSFISIGGPYGGSSVGLKTVLSGIPKLPFLKERYYNIMQRSSGLALALPNALGYHENDILLFEKQGHKAYTIHDYHETLPEFTYDMWEKHVRPIVPLFLENTGVKTIMVTTTNSSTEYGYVYDTINTEKIREPEEIRTTTGDSIVTANSLSTHERRRLNYLNYDFVNFKDADLEHTSVLFSQDLYELIMLNV